MLSAGVLKHGLGFNRYNPRSTGRALRNCGHAVRWRTKVGCMVSGAKEQEGKCETALPERAELQRSVRKDSGGEVTAVGCLGAPTSRHVDGSTAGAKR